MMPIAPMAPSQYVSPFDALKKKQAEMAGMPNAQAVGQASGMAGADAGGIAGANAGSGAGAGQLFASRIAGGFK
jgi:hypothetical protein